MMRSFDCFQKLLVGGDAAFDRRARETCRTLNLFPAVWETQYLSQVTAVVFGVSCAWYTYTHTCKHTHTPPLIINAETYAGSVAAKSHTNRHWKHRLVSSLVESV